MFVLAVSPRTITSNLNGTPVDTGLFAAKITAVQSIGTLGGVNSTLAGKFQETVDGVVWTDVPGATFTLVGASDTIQQISFTKSLQYIRYVGTVTGLSPQIPISVTVEVSPTFVSTGSVSAADLLRQYLIDQDIVEPAPSDLSLFDKTKFAATTGGFSTELDKMVTLIDTGAITQQRSNRGHRTIFPTVSISIRCPAPYSEGYAKGKAIEDAFDTVGAPVGILGRNYADVTFGGSQYRLESVTVTSPTMKVGFEEQNRRQIFSLLAKLTAIKL